MAAAAQRYLTEDASEVPQAMTAVARKCLPEQTRIPVQGGAFATARLRKTRDQMTICCIRNPDGTSTPRVIIACSDGTLHTFTIDPVSGGESVYSPKFQPTSLIQKNSSIPVTRPPPKFFKAVFQFHLMSSHYTQTSV